MHVEGQDLEAAMGRVKADIQFPFINLEKSLARAKQLYDADHRGNEMSVGTAFAVWGYSEKSSGGFQTVSALKMYGFIEEGSAGKIKLTKHAMDYFRDEREDHRAQRLQDFATNPPFLMDLFNHWGTRVPSDTVARSYLKIDRGLNEQSSRSLLGIFKENITFANVKGEAKPPEIKEDNSGDPTAVKIGDYIQWKSLGVDQFKQPQKVTWIADDGTHLRVHASMTGIPIGEVSVVAAPRASSFAAAASSALASSGEQGDNAEQGAMSVLLTGKRLQISADVDAVGLAKLKDILVKYEEILKML
jgi:hypothetical protein